MDSYKNIISKIEALQRQAEKTRKDEIKGVIRDIKSKIAEYGITAEDLGFTPRGQAGSVQKKPKGDKLVKVLRKRKGSRSGLKVMPKYRDDNGNQWTGRGKQPNWLRTAISSGKTLDSFLIHRSEKPRE